MHPIKKSISIAGILAFACILPTQASVLVEELFDYPESGVLAGQNGGIGFKNGVSWRVGSDALGTGAVMISANGSASVDGVGGVWASRDFTPISGKEHPSIYISWDMAIPAYQAKSGGYDCIEFIGTQSGTDKSIVGFSIGVGFESWGFMETVENKGSTDRSNKIGSKWQTSAGVETRFVAKLVFDSDGHSWLTVWLNPRGEMDEPVYTAPLGYSLESLTKIVFRRYHSSSMPGRVTEWDNLRIGSDWKSVVGSADQ